MENVDLVNALIDEVKLKIGAKTDYRLSKMLEISEQDIGKYRKGIMTPDAYACFKFAEVLGKAPSVVIAQVQATKAKAEHKRLYFKRFFSIAWLWIILGFILPSYNTSTAHAYEAGSRANIDFPAHYAKLLSEFRQVILAIFCRYFTCNWHVKFS